MIKVIKRAFQKIANEPVVVLSTGLLSAAGWAGPIVSDNFNEQAFDAKFGTVATVIGMLVGLISRQFVTPANGKAVAGAVDESANVDDLPTD